MDFEQALAYLRSLGHETLAIKFGLENIRLLLEALGGPQQAFPRVQIAGTNGKGSTASMLESVARAAGIRTGLYTSPHLASVTERIRVNGQDISTDAFARLTNEVRAAALRLVESGALQTLPTFFEQVTAISLRAFREARVELAILETGLGGRLDATTAAYAETVAITPIALDHQEYLGETLAEIAAEKAAIIRPGVRAVIAQQPAEALAVILKRCAECSVEPLLAGSGTEVTGADERGRLRLTFRTRADVYERVRLSLPGRHQAINASVAIRLAETLREQGFGISRAAIIAGLASAAHPGRLEWSEGEPLFLFDGAHNVEGARALRAYLDEFVPKPLTVVFGAMRDKDMAGMASIIFPAAERLILTEIGNTRTATLDTLRQLAAQQADASRVTLADNVAEALRSARAQTAPGGTVCVTGSLYLIGEARELLPDEKYQSHAS